MVHAWILVADNSRARLFSAPTRGPLEESADFIHAQSRMKRGELISDTAGRYLDGKGPHRSAMTSPTDPKVHEAERFAHELINALEKGRNEHAFSHVYVCAPPAMLGLLRGLYSPPLRRAVVLEVDKNLVGLTTRVIRDHLPERL